MSIHSQPYTKTIFVGNVIRDPNGNKWIVSRTTDTYVEGVSFNYQNVSGGATLDDYTLDKYCSNINDCGQCDDECEWCHGTGRVTETMRGWKYSEVLATSVKEYILSGVKRLWDI